ncbi:hypothetical protein ACFPJ1_03875 [Kribbella qitaiheensis]|uniref:hypothetical protein n=1 Tax=Kribbella qitaiheensis TaxID=1544730 RepID=UPI00360EBAD4
MGDLQVFRDGEVVDIRGSVVPRALALLALAGAEGLKPQRLKRLLYPDSSDSADLNGVHQSLRTLRNDHGVPITNLKNGAGAYRLGGPEVEVSVDAWDFVEGMSRLASAAHPDGADVDQVRHLLSIWRGNPFDRWQIDEQDTVLGEDRAALVEAARRVVDRRQTMPELVAFADCFPDETRLRRLVEQQSPQGKLLIVEDQVLDALTEILEAEGFDVLPVSSYVEWLKVKNSGELDDVRGALIDRHLNADLTPRDEGLRIAEYLRDRTSVRPSLLTVDTDPSTIENENLLVHYRLLDCVRKEAAAGGRLDERSIRKAAENVMSPEPAVARRWLERCLDSARLRADATFGQGTIGRSRLKQFRDELKVVEALLERGEFEEASEEFTRLSARRE